MRVAQVLIGLVFLGFATVQLNDPDALKWVLAYVLVACNCAAAAAGRPSAVASLVLAAVLTTWATVIAMDDATALSGLSMDGLMHSEVAREIVGLVLGASWGAVTGIHALRRTWRAHG